MASPGAGTTQHAARWPTVLLFVGAIVLCWSTLPALLQTVPHADNIEQLNWAHALQWGYVKHPPLPTALLWLASRLFGPSAYLTYLLALLCVGVTLLLLWRCALLLGGPRMALTALLLSSANYYLMGRGSFFNHNTVMLPFVAASAWAVLRIVQDRPGRGAWLLWVLLGLSQALGMLTKYQMAIVIAANAAALLAAGPWRQPGRALPFAGHVLIGAAATLLPLLPHLAWLRQHDYSSFSYAGQSLLADLPPGQRLQHTLGFAAQQLGRLAPVLAALGLALALQRWGGRRLAAPDAANPTDASNPRDQQPDTAARLARALWCLALVPIAVVLALALFGGVAPQNHWGASATLLIPLLLATRLRGKALLGSAATLAAVLAVQVMAVAWNIVAAHEAPGFHHTFAAKPLATLALDHWQRQVGGPLMVVAGPDWDAGAISLELPSHPAVLASGDRRQAPWITDAVLARCGALVLWRPGQPPEQQVGPALAARMTAPVILEVRSARGVSSTLGAAVIAPTAPGCAGALP